MLRLWASLAGHESSHIGDYSSQGFLGLLGNYFGEYYAGRGTGEANLKRIRILRPK